MVTKSTDLKRTTDVFFDLESGSAKYRTSIDKINKLFVKYYIKKLIIMHI